MDEDTKTPEDQRFDDVIKTLLDTVKTLKDLLRDSHTRADAERDRADRIQRNLEALRAMHQEALLEISKMRASAGERFFRSITPDE